MRKLSSNAFIYLSWGIVAFIIIASYFKFPLSSPLVGDESYYVNEVDFFAKYGFYRSLAQGTSFVYTLLIYICSKIFFVDFVVGARIASIVFFSICCSGLLKCLGQFTDVEKRDKYTGVVFFGVLSSLWLWKALADIPSDAFVIYALYFCLNADTNKKVMLAGLLAFLGFAIKPIVLLALPGILMVLFLRNVKVNAFRTNFTRTALFTMTFLACFFVYHIPGYNTYHKLVLEDKNHFYQNDKRIERKTSWGELNTYYESYNPKHRVNKWAVTFGEVDSFEAQHPEIDLHLTYTQYVRIHFSAFALVCVNKIFLGLPYSIQNGFFFAKWTAINRFIKSIVVIQIISFFIFLFICFRERRFIKVNLLLFLAPLSYYLILSLYTIPQLEDNWLLYCTPLLSLPVVKFLNKYLNIYVLLTLQLVYFLIIKF